MKDEEWLGFGRRVEAHLAQLEKEMAALRDTLRDAGIQVRRQRIRITRGNARAHDALTLLRASHPDPLRAADVAQLLGKSPEYAFDLLASLVADGTAERVGRGWYRAVVPFPLPPRP